jgi:hypothetical protein
MIFVLFSLAALLAGSASQSVLEREAANFAEAWSEKEIGTIGEGFAEKGIRLHLPDEDHLLIRPRQARAAVEAFLGRYRGGEAVVTRVSVAGGSPEKGFAEILWRTSSPGLPDPVTFTLFVGFSLLNDRWTVTEIRVLF